MAEVQRVKKYRFRPCLAQAEEKFSSLYEAYFFAGYILRDLALAADRPILPSNGNFDEWRRYDEKFAEDVRVLQSDPEFPIIANRLKGKVGPPGTSLFSKLNLRQRGHDDG